MKERYVHLRTADLPETQINRLNDELREAYRSGQIRPYADGLRRPAYEFQVVTICELLPDDGTPAVRGYALCSLRDNFSRKKGRTIAKGRALGQLNRRLLAGVHA